MVDWSLIVCRGIHTTERNAIAMPRASVRGVDIEYETFGDPSAPSVILISGGGAQLTFWQVEFCEQLAARGFQVIRFDNRDVGLSTSFDELGIPNVPAVRDGLEPTPYTLEDMADDAIGVLDAVGAEAAHVVGISLGGYIAQVLAIRHPDRVLSFVSMASGVGGPDNVYGNYEYAVLGMSADEAPNEPDLDTRIEQRLDEIQWMSTPQWFDRDAVRGHVRRAMERAQNPAGVERQAAAVHAGASRAAALRDVKVPALILHGELDPHLPVENAHRTKAAMPDAELVIMPDVAHDFPRQIWERVIDHVARLAERAEGVAHT